MSAFRRARFGLVYALVGYVVIFAAQVTGYIFTRALAILAQALETLTAILMVVVLLLALAWTRRRRSLTQHPFRIRARQGIALCVVACAVIAFSAGTLWEAVKRLVVGIRLPVRNVNIGMAALLLGMAFVTVPIIDIVRSKLHGEPIGMRIVSFVKDELSYLAGIVGTALAAAGHAWADPVASLVIGVLVGVGGILLVRDSILCLAGKSL